MTEIINQEPSNDQPITPKQMLMDDERAKKSAIYHPRVKTRNYYAERSAYNKQCGDSIIWKSGYPMSFEDFLTLPSDETRKEYLQSIIDKYPGITVVSLSVMFDITKISVKKIIDFLGIKYTPVRGRHDLESNERFISDVEKCFGDPEYKNVEIRRKKQLPTLPRYTYSELTKMTLERQSTYFNNIMDRYCHLIHIKVLSEFFECSTGSVYALMKSIGYKSKITIPIDTHCRLSHVMNKRFNEEMMTKRRSFPSRKIDTINEAINNINTTGIDIIEHTISVENINPDHHNSIETTLFDIGASVSSLELNATIGETAIFSDAFVKMISDVFGDHADIKIKIEKR